MSAGYFGQRIRRYTTVGALFVLPYIASNVLSVPFPKEHPSRNAAAGVVKVLHNYAEIYTPSILEPRKDHFASYWLSDFGRDQKKHAQLEALIEEDNLDDSVVRNFRIPDTERRQIRDRWVYHLGSLSPGKSESSMSGGLAAKLAAPYLISDSATRARIEQVADEDNLRYFKGSHDHLFAKGERAKLKRELDESYAGKYPAVGYLGNLRNLLNAGIAGYLLSRFARRHCRKRVTE